MATRESLGGRAGVARSDEGAPATRRGRVDPYPLAVRPLVAAPPAAPVVDLRPSVDVLEGDTADAWADSLDYVRRCVARRAAAPVADEPIKRFDRRRGADAQGLGRVLDALDDGRPVAFYGWWPTAATASTVDILGVDVIDVPPPDRKGRDVVDGHAVVIVGYGRHDAFPGGGYVIVRSGWAADGWGDGGDGYVPFTYLRTYATELRTSIAC